MPNQSSITVPGFGEVPVVALGTIDGSFGPAGFGSDDEEPIFLSPIQRRLRERGGLFGFGGGTLSMLHSLAFSGLGAGLGLRPVSGSGTATGRNAPNSSLGGSNNNLGAGHDSNFGGSGDGGGNGSNGTSPQHRSLGLLDLHNRVSDLVRVRTPVRRSVASSSSGFTTAQFALPGPGQAVRPEVESDVDEDGHRVVGGNEDSATEDGEDDVCEDEDEALDYMDVDEAGEGEEYGEDDFDMDACDSHSYEAESVEASAARSLDSSGGRRRRATTESSRSCGTDNEASRCTLPALGRAGQGGDPLNGADGCSSNDVGLSEEDEPLLAAHRAAEAQAGEHRFLEGSAELQSSPETRHVTPPGLDAAAEIGRASGDTALPPLHPASGVEAVRAAGAIGAAQGLASGPRWRDNGTLSVAWAAARFALSAMLAPVRFVMFVARLSSGALSMPRASRVHVRPLLQVTVAGRPADRRLAPHSDGPAAAAGSGPCTVSGAEGQAGWRWQIMPSAHASHAQGDELSVGTCTNYRRPTLSSPGDRAQILADAEADNDAGGSVRYRAPTDVAATPTMAPPMIEPIGLLLPALAPSQGQIEHDAELPERSPRDQLTRRLENRSRHVPPVVIRARLSHGCDGGNAASGAPGAGAATPPLLRVHCGSAVSSADALELGEQASVSNPLQQLHPSQAATLSLLPIPLLFHGTLPTTPVPCEGIPEAQAEAAGVTVQATFVAVTDEETVGQGRDTAPACTAVASGTEATRTSLPGFESLGSSGGQGGNMTGRDDVVDSMAVGATASASPAWIIPPPSGDGDVRQPTLDLPLNQLMVAEGERSGPLGHPVASTRGSDVPLRADEWEHSHVAFAAVQRVSGCVAAPVTTAGAIAAEQRSRRAAGSRRQRVRQHSEYEAAGGRVAAAAEATGPRNLTDVGAEADEESSTSESDADIFRIWGRQLLDADLEQLFSLAAYRCLGPGPIPESLQVTREQGSGTASPATVSARPFAARILGAANRAAGETGEGSRPLAHCVAPLSSLPSRPRPFGTPRVLLGMTRSARGHDRPLRPRQPGGFSHGDHMPAAPRDSGAVLQGGTDVAVAVAAGAAARAPLLLWGNRLNNPEFSEQLLMRRAASMENVHCYVRTMPAPAATAASGRRGMVTQARQSMVFPAAPPFSAAILATPALRVLEATAFEPGLLRLPNTELGVTALNMLSGPTPRPTGERGLAVAGGMSNEGGGVPTLLASAAGAVAEAAASGSPGSGLWDGRYNEERRHRPARAIQDVTGDLPAIGATTLRPALPHDNEEDAAASNQAPMGGWRGAPSRLRQLGEALRLSEDRRRPPQRQQRTGRHAWQDHGTTSNVLDSNDNRDGSIGPWRYYYSDGNTNHRALLSQIPPRVRVPLLDAIFPRTGTPSSSGCNNMLGALHVGPGAQFTAPTRTSFMEVPYSVRHVDWVQRRSRSSLVDVGAGHAHNCSAAGASSENPQEHRPGQPNDFGEVGSRDGSTVSTSSEIPDLVSDPASSPEWDWPHAAHQRQRQRPFLWLQRRHELIAPVLFGWQRALVPPEAPDFPGLHMATRSRLMSRRARATYTSQEDVDADTQSETGLSSDFHTPGEGSPAVAAAVQIMVAEGLDNSAASLQTAADVGPSASGGGTLTDRHSSRLRCLEHEDERTRARLAWLCSDTDDGTSDGSDLPIYWWASPRDQQPSEGGVRFACGARNAVTGSLDHGGIEVNVGAIEMPLSSCSTEEGLEANGTAATADGDGSDGDLLPPALVDSEEENEETSAPDDETGSGLSSVPFLIDEDSFSTLTVNYGNAGSSSMEGDIVAAEGEGHSQALSDLWLADGYQQDYGDWGNTPSVRNRRHCTAGERVIGRYASSEMDSDNHIPDLVSSSELEPFLHSRADRGQAGGGTIAARVNPITAPSRLESNGHARSRPGSRTISIPSEHRQLLQPSTRRSPIGSTAIASRNRTYALSGVSPAGIRSESAGVSSVSVYRRMAEQMYLEAPNLFPSDQDGGAADSDASSDSMPPLVSLNSLHSGSRGSSGRLSLEDNDATEPRTGGPAVVRRRLAWAEYQGFPSSQRQQEASLPSAAAARGTATELAPQRSHRGSQPAQPRRTASISTSVAGTTDDLTSTEADSTWGAAVEALLRVLVDVRSGDRVSADAGGSVASRAVWSASTSIAHLPVTTAAPTNDPRPRPIAVGNGAGSTGANGSSSRGGPTSQIVASLVRIPADVLSNVPPGSVLSITIPAGGLSTSVRGGSDNISGAGSSGDGGGSRPRSNTTAARILPLPLGAFSSFPLSWRSYLPLEESSGRHPNDNPGLPGIYDERDIPPWAARFAPQVPSEPPTRSESAAGSGLNNAQQVVASAATLTTRTGIQQNPNAVAADDSNPQTRSIPASWEAQWDDISFSNADDEDGVDDGGDDGNTNYGDNNMVANQDGDERNCQSASDSEDQQNDTESLPNSLPDLVPPEESPAGIAASTAARLRGLEGPASQEVTAANTSEREVVLPLASIAAQRELTPRLYFVDMSADVGTPMRRVEGRDGEGNVTVDRESGGAAAQAVSLDDARAAAYHLHSAAAHLPHELQHLQDGSHDRSPAPADVPGAGEARETRGRRVAAPVLGDSIGGYSDVGVMEMLTELEGLPQPLPTELHGRLQHPDWRQPHLRDHNSVGPVLQGVAEQSHSGAGLTAAVAVNALHEGPDSRHVRRGSAPARVPLPPMPDGAGAAPPQHSPLAVVRGSNTVSRYAGPDMEEGDAEPQSLLLGTATVLETSPTAVSGSGRGVPVAQLALGPTREPGSVPTRRNAVTYHRNVLLNMLEALQISETAASSSHLGSSHGSIMAAAAAHAPSTHATAPATRMVGMGFGPQGRVTRSASHIAATAALLRDDSFVAQLLGGLPGVAIRPPACCVQETVRMLQSGEEGLGLGCKFELCNVIVD
ncbi:hypothetical protein VaNZ11_005356 [Volvox africanus]|uniref:Uncharacterized protein n=1 Tax=Volvox africanus TaxID=51714 RepID=A0ABQ5RYM1_9CHLO|nr:hypothetical protein VaNZ11_005356 [Volvox africanus]